MPTGLDVTACRGILSFLHFSQNSSTVFQISLPRLAQINTARSAREQLRANALLQRRHRPGNAGGGQTQTPRCCGKALVLGDGGEDLHFLEAVHGRVLDSDKKNRNQVAAIF
ncbi:hypothetical protein D9M71_669640 [compost metagenome]